MSLDVGDEQRHTPAPDATWCEHFAFDFVADDSSVAGALQLTLFGGDHSALFSACLVRPGRRLLTLVDDELAAPRGLEVRAPGLWVDIQCLVPFDHVTVGLEAFAMELEDPSEALGRIWGERVPFGLDLEWDTTGPIAEPGHPRRVGYEMSCRVHGEILVGDERIEFDAFGSRRHVWGTPHPWANTWRRALTSRGTAVGELSVVSVLAEAPLLVRLGADTFRVDRSLCTVRDVRADDATMPAWIERCAPC